MKNIDTESNLVCEALVREISSATRWEAVHQAWLGLLNVRGMAEQIKEEELEMTKTFDSLQFVTDEWHENKR